MSRVSALSPHGSLSFVRASFWVQAGSRHAFEAHVNTEIKVYFSHSNKVCLVLWELPRGLGSTHTCAYPHSSPKP